MVWERCPPNRVGWGRRPAEFSMTHSRSRQAVLLCVAVLGVTFAARELFVGTEETVTRTNSNDPDAAGPRRSVLGPNLAVDPTATAEPSLEPETTREEFEVPRAVHATPYGQVRVAATLPGVAPELQTFEARFQNEQRFAEIPCTTSAEVKLTTGSWTGALIANGFDPIELPPFSIHPDTETDLGTFAFEPGSARIHGRIRMPRLSGPASDAPWIVDLFGAETTLCASCVVLPEGVTAPCERCGAFIDRWRRSVAHASEFTFFGLLAGRYRLHAFQPGYHDAGVEAWVELSRGGMKFVDLEAMPLADLEFELVDELGRPFTGVIEHDGRLRRPFIRFTFERDGRANLTASFRAETPQGEELNTAEALRATLFDMIEFGAIGRTSIAFTDSSSFEPSVEPPPFVDRARERGDHPTVVRSATAGSEIGVNGKHGSAANRFVVASLPMEMLRVTARCSGYGSDPIDVDLRLGSAAPVRLVMIENHAPPEQFIEIELGESLSRTLDGAIRFEGSPTLELRLTQPLILDATEPTKDG